MHIHHSNIACVYRLPANLSVGDFYSVRNNRLKSVSFLMIYLEAGIIQVLDRTVEE